MHSHLIRHPIPVDYEMPYAKEGACSPENVLRAFPDEHDALLAAIFVAASQDNDEGETVWAGVNTAYLQRLVSIWWARKIGRSWFWLIKALMDPPGYAQWKVEQSMRTFLEQKLVEEVIEWDYVESESLDGEPIGYESNQNMPVYYPTPALIERLNEALV